MADALSPAYVREGVEFSVKLRGYDLEQVDEFLDRVADHVDELQRQVRQITERAVRAEQLAADNAETDQALRRTLVVAQRTADEVVAEAEAEAARRREEAEATARSIIVAAEAEAARLASEAQRKLRTDIAALEAARDALQADIDALDQHLNQERERLRRLADGELTAAPAPAATEVTLPPEPVVAEPTPAPPDTHVSAAPAVDEPAAASDDAADAATVDDAEPAAAGDDDDSGERTEAVDLRALFDGVDDDAAAAEGAVAAAAHDDPFLAELRKASDDDAPLGPRDDVDVFAGFGPADGEHDLGLDRSRWGRRRRR